MIALLFSIAFAVAPAPEIARPPGRAQAIGVAHGLRNVPEACVRLEGMFTATGYVPKLVPRPGCQARAPFEPAIGAAAPSGDGWILNDLLSVPRADRPDCVATVHVWRHPGALAPIGQDGQKRVRVYLDEAAPPAARRPRFAASLEVAAACGN